MGRIAGRRWIVLVLAILAPACGGGRGESEDRGAHPPSPSSTTSSPFPSPSPSQVMSVEAARQEAAEAACNLGRRAELYELPDPFGALIPTGTAWDGRPWLIGKVPCDELEVVGRSEPVEVVFDNGFSGAPFCPYLAVRHGGDRGWVAICASGEAMSVLPPVVVEPLAPGGRADLALEAEQVARVGDPCTRQTGVISGWTVSVRNRGDGTSAELIELVKTDGERTTETFRLIRGLEPGEVIEISAAADHSTVRLDPRQETPDADRSNNLLELGETPDLICS